MMIALYQALGAVAMLVLVALAPVVPALRRGLGERFGRAPRGEAPSFPGAGSGPIWIHAASVGEVRAAAPLVSELLRRRPESRILLSTFTAGGKRVAEQWVAAGEPRVRCLLSPLDWGWIPGRVIRREDPALFILLETELWPVLLTSLRRAGVPVLVANGRISPRSFGRYRALAGSLRPVLDAITLALVRTAEDASRYVAIGVAPPRVRVAGNLKHTPGGARSDGSAERAAAMRRRLGAADGRRVLVAGSLRGVEANLVLEVFDRLRAVDPSLLLVLAPRHPERFDERKLGRWGGAAVRWSAAPERIGPETAVVLLDTLGELADSYAAAVVACVGGTWSEHGGHNLLEPAHHGVPVVFGPDFRHFDEEGRALLAAGGGFQADDADGIFEHCRRLLEDGAAREEAGRRARRVASSFGGAVETVVGAALDILDERPGAR
jgi:3-deoxy-D-manno-octulosonic-acid transferase